MEIVGGGRRISPTDTMSDVLRIWDIARGLGDFRRRLNGGAVKAESNAPCGAEAIQTQIHHAGGTAHQDTYSVHTDIPICTMYVRLYSIMSHTGLKVTVREATLRIAPRH